MIVSLPGYTLIHVFLSLIGVFAGLVVVGETKVKAAVQKAVHKAEKQADEQLAVDPKDIDQALQRAVGEM